MLIGASLLSVVPAPAIVNGTDATTNPGAVSLWTDNPNRNRCTGTLVDDEQGDPQRTRWVLTAAHCIYPFTDPAAGRVTARMGSTDNSTGYTAIKVVPGQFWYNPAFDPNSLSYDVMLMLLESESPVGAQVMKWRKPSLPLGAVTQAYGWGWVCDGPAGQACSSWYQGPLQTMAAKSVNDSGCYAVAVTQVCFAESTAGSGNGYTMACLGDSGAPMKSPDFDGTPILRWSVVGDGDANYDSCLQGVGGAPGRGLAIDIGRDDIQSWADSVLHPTAARRSVPVPPAATQRALALAG